MKEAMGELNMAVIVVIIVAVLSLFFFTFLWPKMKGEFTADTKCDAAICPAPGESPQDGLVKCYYRDSSGNQRDITCTWKG